MAKYRAHNWLNIKSLKTVFGIQARSNGRWLHCAENGKPLLFRSEKRRDAKLKSLEAKP